METVIQLSAGQFMAMITTLTLAMIGGFWWIGSRVQAQVASDVRATVAEVRTTVADMRTGIEQQFSKIQLDFIQQLSRVQQDFGDKFVTEAQFADHVRHMESRFDALEAQIRRIQK